ncbi:MAG: acyl-CoA thioesterase [Parasphingorhabdus sp.]|jgi:acyl-CoA thioesterase
MTNPKNLAEQCASHMYKNDRASKSLGLILTEVSPGYAQMTMTVREDMLNGHDICHGGIIFTLADSTFAFACNSYNVITVAAGADVQFIRAGKLGDVLSAEATEQARGNKIGTYDITVTNQNNELVALFRGRSYSTRHKMIEET